MSQPLSPMDDLQRCPWPKQDPLYLSYHDQEWGVPEYDDRALYEKLVLDGFQAGLSWITILRLDRVADAGAAGLPLTAGGVTLAAEKPDWARFSLPHAGKAAE